MPVLRCCNQYGVNVFVREQLLIISIHLRLITSHLRCGGEATLQIRFEYVADRRHSHMGIFPEGCHNKRAAPAPITPRLT
jgi:hypothetical protein